MRSVNLSNDELLDIAGEAIAEGLEMGQNVSAVDVDRNFIEETREVTITLRK